jgi:hypothetical protein
MVRKNLPRHLQGLQDQITALPMADLQSLHDWLSLQLQRQLDAAESSTPPKRMTLRQKQLGEVCYKQELMRCSKVGCKCCTGLLHGHLSYVGVLVGISIDDDRLIC